MMQVSEKAYKLNFEAVDLLYAYDPDYYTVHAETADKAKALMWELVKSTMYSFKTGDELTYKGIRVLRNKENDKYNYKGESLTLEQIKRKKKEEEEELHRQRLKEDPTVLECYIIKRGTYYRDNYCGYSDSILGAGKYEKQTALKYVSGDYNLKLRAVDIEQEKKKLRELIKEDTAIITELRKRVEENNNKLKALQKDVKQVDLLELIAELEKE